MSICDFIKNKIVKRTIFASIVPLLLYSIGFGLFKLFASDSNIGYFNLWSWVTLGCFCLIWPLQRVGLFLLFEPIVYMIKRKLRKTAPMKLTKDGKMVPMTPFMNRGNFRAVQHEMSYHIDDIVHGQVPTDLNGTFIKNGPNHQFEDKDIMRSHWFSGDGMLHGFMLKDGNLFYCNRYIKTHRYVREKKAGKRLQPSLQHFTEIGVLLAVLWGIMRNIGYMDGAPLLETQGASTAMIQHAQRTFALLEVDLPFQVKVQPKQNDLEIQSIGFDNFEGQLKHACSAHPKVDRKTNEFLIFSYELGEAVANYSLFDGRRQLKNHFKVPLLSPRMVHDFGLTQNYCIVPDLPLEFDPPGAIKNKRFLYHFNESASARYGIWPRNSRDGKDVKWFEVEPHYVFHFGGQWESVNEQGETIVTLYVVAHPTIDIGFQFFEHWFDKAVLNTFDKYEFNLTTSQTKKTTLIDNMYLEFPNLSQEYYGYRSRYCYIACRAPIDVWPNEQAELDDMLYTGFIKYDTFEEKIVKIVPFGDNCIGAEVYYQQRDGSDPLKDEDDGYVMTAVHDWKHNKSHFVIWDAKTLEPVLDAGIRERVPYGFHSTFVHENDY